MCADKNPSLTSAGSEKDLVAATLTIGAEQVAVWPEGQDIVSLDPSIKLTKFSDFERFCEPIIAKRPNYAPRSWRVHSSAVWQ